MVNLLPKEKIEIAGVVGSDLDPANGLEHGDATTYTLWGEMAYQLKGIEGYRVLEASDKQRVAPSTQTLDKLISDAPTLIMLDELAHHLRVVKGMVGETSLRRVATTIFLYSLTQGVASGVDPADMFASLILRKFRSLLRKPLPRFLTA